MTRLQHLLVCLTEECAEVAQAATKALRFGLDDINPHLNITAESQLTLELIDLKTVVEMLIQEGVSLQHEDEFNLMNLKEAKVEKFLKFSHERGQLT